MTTVDYIRTVIHYNIAMHNRVWDCIMHISDAQFLEPVDYSIGSVRNHMVHLINVDRRWLARAMDTPLPVKVPYEAFTTRAATRQEWNAVADSYLRVAETLTAARLAQQRIMPWSKPSPRESTVWRILVHVVNHGTDHRAQVLPILHRMGAPTLEQDMMLFWWED